MLDYYGELVTLLCTVCSFILLHMLVVINVSMSM